MQRSIEFLKLIKIWEQYGTPNPPVIPNKGMFNDTTISAYQNFPIKATDFGAINHIRPSDVNMNLKLNYAGDNVKENDTLNFNDASLNINEDITFTVNTGAGINISGANGKLDSKTGSTIIFPVDFKLNIFDLAGMNSSGTTFTTTGENIIWDGIRLENPGNVYISNNCVFNNAKIAVSSVNSNNFVTNISGSTFNIPIMQETDHYGIKLINANNVLIDGNIFNLSEYNNSSLHSAGFSIQNYIENFTVPSIVIQNNNFYNGYAHILLGGYLDNLLPVYLYANNFNNSAYNVLTNGVSVDFDKNLFNHENYSYLAINLYNSSANFLDNTINSNSCCMQNNFSVSNFAPILSSQEEYIWTGGRNKLNSASDWNIDIYSNYVYTNGGLNEFKVQNANAGLSPIFRTKRKA